MPPESRIRRAFGRPIEATHFAEIAELLLNQSRLVVAGVELRIREIEFYLFSAPHPDPFTHCTEHQLASGRLYFHRQGEGYRGGSFKGVDITAGGPGVHAGILIRSLSQGDSLTCGPSLVVDRLLALTELTGVAELDEAIGSRSLWDSTSPIALSDAPPRSDEILTTARIGLTLKRVAAHPAMPDYVDRRYRFLNAPRQIRKGRELLARALSEDGLDASQIARRTGSPRSAIDRWLEREV